MIAQTKSCCTNSALQLLAVHPQQHQLAGPSCCGSCPSVSTSYAHFTKPFSTTGFCHLAVSARSSSCEALPAAAAAPTQDARMSTATAMFLVSTLHCSCSLSTPAGPAGWPHLLWQLALCIYILCTSHITLAKAGFCRSAVRPSRPS
jgi:hypothetical protein